MRITNGVVLAVAAIVAGTCGCDNGSGDAASGSPSPSPAPTKQADKASPQVAEEPEEVVEVKEGWGHLKGKFVYDDAAPAQLPLSITKDQDFCGQHTIVDESLVVSKDGGLANVVVQLYLKRGESAPEPHESYAETAAVQVELDNDKCRFEPHVCVLRTSQTLVIKNSDSVGHNTNIGTLSNPAFNQTIPAGSELEHHLTAAERRPATVTCNIHPWMKGWVLPSETPYFAVSSATGEFEIRNLPAGKWTFQFWHEQAGGIAEVTVDGKATKWSKGRVAVSISGDATTDLGEIKVAADQFKD